jgi:bidirectional [NiFe] hydrogenase diaphorase subunit
MTDTPETVRTARDRPAGGRSGDNRMRILEATMKRHQYQPDALIEVLHKAQELFGFLSPDLLTSIAQNLHLPPSRVYGVATFYHFFSLAPQGKHSCTVCLGTACYVKGAAELLKELEQYAGIGAGETTTDGQFSLVVARCLGACGIAPAAVFDGEVIGHAVAADLVRRLHTVADEETE